MTHKLKVLAAGVVALAAIVGTPSVAAAAQFHSESESTVISGVPTTTARTTTTAGEITCQKTTFSGTATAKTVSSLFVSLVSTECHMIIFGSTVSVTVNNNGCGYTLYASGVADVTCPAGKEMVVTAAGCTVKLPAQTGLKSVSYKNNGSHIDATINVSGVKYSHSGFTCGTGSGTTGTMTGAVTISGKNTGGSATKVWYE